MTSGAGTSAFQQAPFAASYTGSSTPFLMANPTSQLLSVPHWHLPISSSMPVLPEVDVPLKRADYPGVRFWTRAEWMDDLKNTGDSSSSGKLAENSRGRTLVSQGINKTAKYIEDVNGNSVDGHKLRNMLNYMRSIWSTLLTLNRAPTTWGKANMETLRHFRREMCTKFPEFALCDNDWKADCLATTHYPSWYSNHVKSVAIKEAKDPGAAEQSTTSKTKKRTKKVNIVYLQYYR